MIRDWECPNCVAQARTVDSSTPMHHCRGTRGLLVPLVPAGTKAKLVIMERGDYVRKETVQTDGEGRPVMAVATTRDDGEDCTIYAPCAVAEAE